MVAAPPPHAGRDEMVPGLHTFQIPKRAAELQGQSEAVCVYSVTVELQLGVFARPPAGSLGRIQPAEAASVRYYLKELAVMDDLLKGDRL